MDFAFRNNRPQSLRNGQWIKRGIAYLALIAAIGFTVAIVLGLVQQ